MFVPAMNTRIKERTHNAALYYQQFI